MTRFPLILDLVFLMLGVAFLNTAITGSVYPARRGGGKAIGSVHSVRGRVVCVIVSVCMFFLFLWLVTRPGK